jgi:hypothetical protein
LFVMPMSRGFWCGADEALGQWPRDPSPGCKWCCRWTRLARALAGRADFNSGVTGATVTMLSGAGTCTIDANQAGSASYLPTAQAQTSETAQLASQTITLTTSWFCYSSSTSAINTPPNRTRRPPSPRAPASRTLAHEGGPCGFRLEVVVIQAFKGQRVRYEADLDRTPK